MLTTVDFCGLVFLRIIANTNCLKYPYLANYLSSNVLAICQQKIARFASLLSHKLAIR